MSAAARSCYRRFCEINGKDKGKREVKMTMDEVLKKLSDKFGSKILNVNKRSDKKSYVDIYPKDINEFVRYLFKDCGFRFNTASGVDDFDSLEILYHFSHDSSGIVISLRALV